MIGPVENCSQCPGREHPVSTGLGQAADQQECRDGVVPCSTVFDVVGVSGEAAWSSPSPDHTPHPVQAYGNSTWSG